MKARAVVSIGVVLSCGVLAGVFNSACSSNDTPVAGAPGTAGSNGNNAGTNTGGSASGGSGTGGSGTGGAAAGSGGMMATGGGLAMIDGKCPPNSIKKMDNLCYCQPASLSACVDGCGDFMIDPDHCGNCTTKCKATQACNAGKCGAEPKVVVPAAAGCESMQIAVQGGNLYYTDKMHGTVSSVPVAGGAAKAVGTAQKAPTAIKVSATDVFWIASGDKTVMTAPIAGGAPTVIVPAQKDDKQMPVDIGGITLSDDGKTLYFSAGTAISKAAVPAGTITPIGKEASGIPRALAVSGTFVASPIEVNGDVDVMVTGGAASVCASENDVGFTNTACNRLARSQGSLVFDNIVISGDGVYWANGLNISTASASAPSGFNDNVVQSPTATANTLTAFTVAKNVVYGADDGGVIFSAPLMKDQMPTTMVRGQMKPTSLAADDANLYWANGDCSILSIPLK